MSVQLIKSITVTAPQHLAMVGLFTSDSIASYFPRLFSMSQGDGEYSLTETDVFTLLAMLGQDDRSMSPEETKTLDSFYLYVCDTFNVQPGYAQLG